MTNLVSNYQPAVNLNENTSRCLNCPTNAICYCHIYANNQITTNHVGIFDFLHQQLEKEAGRSRTSSLSESHNRSYSPNFHSLSPPKCVSDSHITTNEAYDISQQSLPSQSLNQSLFSENFGGSGDDNTWHCGQCYNTDPFSFRCEKCKLVLCNSCASLHMMDALTKDHFLSRISKASISSFSAAVGSEIRSPIRQEFKEDLTMSLVPYNSTMRQAMLDVGIHSSLPDTSLITQETVNISNRCGHKLLNDYCLKCFILICSNCHEEHKNHQIISLLDSKEVFRDIFMNLLKESDKRLKEVSSALDEAQGVFQHLEDAEIITTNVIETAFNNIINVLNVRKKKLVSTAKTITFRKKETLTNQMKILQQSKQKFTEIQITAKNLFYCNRISEQAAVHGKMEKEMRSLEYVSTFLRPHENDMLSFASPSAELCKSLYSFGRIDCSGHAQFSFPFGVSMYNVIDGWISQISVQSVCSSGENRILGGDDVKAFMFDDKNECKKLSVQDHGTGLYTIRFLLHKGFPRTISVTIRDQYIRNVPFNPTIKMLVPYESRKTPTLTLTEGIQRPWGVHCDGDGYIYVTDRTNNCVHVFNCHGKYDHKIGSYGESPGYFNRPAGVTVDSNRRVIVADKDNHRVQIFTFTGEFLLTFGHNGDGNGEFRYPWGVAVDLMGNIVVADTRNYRVQIFDSNGKHISSLSGNNIPSLNNNNIKLRDLECPRGICCAPNGQIFITDFNRHRIAVISRDYCSFGFKFFGIDGSLPDKSGRFGTCKEALFRPQGITIDGNGNLLIVDTRHRRLCVFTIRGEFRCEFALGTDKEPLLKQPLDIAISPDGHIFVVELAAQSIYRF